MPYTAAPGTVGYGGAISGFASEGDLTGAAELNPHNTVHVMIGGVGTNPGWMSDPTYAALDPIFWLHHCNIDRLWEAWMSHVGNIQERSSAWSNGPFPRQFAMPDPAKNRTVFLPGDTLPGGPLAPTYDDLYRGTGIPQPTAVAPMSGASPSRIRGGSASGSGGPRGRTGGPIGGSSGLPGGGGGSPGGSGSVSSGGGSVTSTLIGANDRVLTIKSTPVATRVALDTKDLGSRKFAPNSSKSPRRFYLNLEGVRGEAPSAALEITIKKTGAVRSTLIETVTLFGLARASSTTGRHAGNGLSIVIEITEWVNSFKSALSMSKGVKVEISQPGGIDTPITVDRISIYQKPSD